MFSWYNSLNNYIISNKCDKVRSLKRNIKLDRSAEYSLKEALCCVLLTTRYCGDFLKASYLFASPTTDVFLCVTFFPNM
jgi:hypothetical protein